MSERDAARPPHGLSPSHLSALKLEWSIKRRAPALSKAPTRERSSLWCAVGASSFISTRNLPRVFIIFIFYYVRFAPPPLGCARLLLLYGGMATCNANIPWVSECTDTHSLRSPLPLSHSAGVCVHPVRNRFCVTCARRHSAVCYYFCREEGLCRCRRPTCPWHIQIPNCSNPKIQLCFLVFLRQYYIYMPCSVKCKKKNTSGENIWVRLWVMEFEINWESVC